MTYTRNVDNTGLRDWLWEVVLRVRNSMSLRGSGMVVVGSLALMAGLDVLLLQAEDATVAACSACS